MRSATVRPARRAEPEGPPRLSAEITPTARHPSVTTSRKTLSDRIRSHAKVAVSSISTVG